MSDCRHKWFIGPDCVQCTRCGDTKPLPMPKAMQGVLASALRRSATVVQGVTVAPDTGAAASGVMGPVVTPEDAQKFVADVARMYANAPGLPLHMCTLDELDRWTDMLTNLGYAIGITTCDYAALARDHAARNVEAGTPGAAATSQDETLTQAEADAMRDASERALERLTRTGKQDIEDRRSTTRDRE